MISFPATEPLLSVAIFFTILLKVLHSISNIPYQNKIIDSTNKRYKGVDNEQIDEALEIIHSNNHKWLTND
ncbi:MAG: hypothetical protein QXF61_11630 [Nitrososphaeria archaeon]